MVYPFLVVPRYRGRDSQNYGDTLPTHKCRCVVYLNKFIQEKSILRIKPMTKHSSNVEYTQVKFENIMHTSKVIYHALSTM